MGRKYTKEDTIALKKKSFKKLNKLLEAFINKPMPSTGEDTDYMKKAALISKWLNQYSNYLDFEERFDPTKNISYKRGDIVFVNFGFNIGSEFGGEHYAVILDKENFHNSSTIAVIPLSSFKQNKHIHPNDVYLGNELHDKLQIKAMGKLDHAAEELLELQPMLKLASELEEKLDSKSIQSHSKLVENMQFRIDALKKEVENMQKMVRELNVMKKGSIAKVEQIRSISKIRIYQPKNKSDPLYGIRLSDTSMEKINNKIKELFVFNE